MTASSELTSSNLLAAASELLEGAGYKKVGGEKLREWSIGASRVFEDAYCIAAVVVYDTWTKLRESWPDAQAALGELVSLHVSQGDPKTWDSYLVLLTSGSPTSEEEGEVSHIRYDTTRVRKLVATGDDIRQLADIRRTLLPLLPLHPDVSNGSAESTLDVLPELLRPSVPQDVVADIVRAFRDQQPLMESLHKFRTGQK